MSNRRGTRPSRRSKCDSPLQKLQQAVQRSGTCGVLDSLPVPNSFVFHKTRKKGHDTIKLFLGDRPNPDGSYSEAWARIVSPTERTDLQPPVLFYDQDLTDDGKRTSQYPRSASSLLRKATKLRPPFCFLQHDPVDRTTKVREMLCAIVLYLAATTDADTCAWHWDAFGESLILALRYIHSRDVYHQWRQEQKLAFLSPSESAAAGGGDVQRKTKPALVNDQRSESATDQLPTASLTDSDEYSGGTVQSRGSNIAVKPNTSLAKLKRELGNSKFRSLDNIPSIPIKISRHARGGSLFPFRMWIGNAKYDLTGEIVNVYAYLDHEGTKNASLVFMSHDSDGLEQTYDVNLLRDGVDLVEHLEYLNTLKKDSYKANAKSARTAKLRSLICYYFFIAENEGLIGDPKVCINEGFCKRLWTVCKELGQKDWIGPASESCDKDWDSHDEDYNINTHSPMRHQPELDRAMTELKSQDRSGIESSRIVGLRMRPEVRREVDRNGSVFELGGRLQGQEILSGLLFNGQLRAEAFSKNAPGLELELRPSSQIMRKSSHPQIEDSLDLRRASMGSGKIAPVKDSAADVMMLQVGSLQERTDTDADINFSKDMAVGTEKPRPQAPFAQRQR